MLFVHVRKTGGTTLTRALGNRFGADACLSLYDRLPPTDRHLDRYRYVTGHVDVFFRERFRRAPYVITCLRDPIERALSVYSYYRWFPPTEYEILRPQMGPSYEARIAAMRLSRECSLGLHRTGARAGRRAPRQRADPRLLPIAAGRGRRGSRGGPTTTRHLRLHCTYGAACPVRAVADLQDGLARSRSDAAGERHSESPRPRPASGRGRREVARAHRPGRPALPKRRSTARSPGPEIGIG